MNCQMKNLAEGVLLLVALGGVGGGIWSRHQLKKGIGIRFLQYLGLTVLLPVVAVLSLEERISQEMTGAIAATGVGAVIASIGKDEVEKS